MSWKLAAIVAVGLVLGTALARVTQDSDTGTMSWDAARASGFAGYLLLWASVMAGMLIHARYRPFGYPMTYLIEGHRMISALALSFVTAHVFAMLVDPAIHFSPADVAVPFVSAYRPFQVGLGSLALWLLVLVLASTALSGSMPYRAWRRLHYLAFPCWALALLHGLTNGTDTGATAAVWLYTLTTMSVAVLGFYRIFGRDWVQMGDAPIRPIRR
jgi:sulfoxide reductase heme-binding subunit YedZ